jgi:hypothetical protein
LKRPPNLSQVAQTQQHAHEEANERRCVRLGGVLRARQLEHAQCHIRAAIDVELYERVGYVNLLQ